MILQACSECDRQFDVTHLAIGSRVRCVCDELLLVKPAKLLRAAAHKCSNCGGKVEPGQSACSYCGSKLSPEDLARSTLCPQCFTRLADDAKHCKSCGVGIAPQALTPIPEGKTCPRCKGELLIRSLATASVVECVACGGLWVKPETFESICKQAQNRPEFRLSHKLEPIGAAEPERKVVYVPCLTCDDLMQRKMFRYKGQPSRVIIDYCRNHGVWLDQHELERVVGFIRRRVDVEMPFDAGEALAGGKQAGMGPIYIGGRDPWVDDFGTLGTFFALGMLGDALGGILGEIFD